MITITGPTFRRNKENSNTFMVKLENCTSQIHNITQRIEAGLIPSAGEKIQKLYIKSAISTMKIKIKHKKTENI